MTAVQYIGQQSEAIQRVQQLLRGRQDGVADFARRMYRLVAPEDLDARNPEDLAEAAASLWELLARRAPGEVLVRVFNPEPQRDGWSSPYTAVQLVSDDMPFIVDSVTMTLNREGCGLHLVIHPVLHVRRDQEGHPDTRIRSAPTNEAPGGAAESALHLEISRVSSPERRAELEAILRAVIGEVTAAVRDWQPMRGQALELASELERLPATIAPDERDESVRFLRWLATDHFTFLGYREYELLDGEEEAELRPVPDSGLGILAGPPSKPAAVLGDDALIQARARRPLVLTKANSRATVHRPAYLDYVGVKRFGANGEVVGERRFLGLYTSTAYRETAREVPLLSEKVEAVLDRSGLPRDSHDAKALIEIIESYPRDSLLQIGADELAGIALGVLALGERQRVKLFVRRDPLRRFADCLVFVPRDRAGAASRARITEILLEAFDADQAERTMLVSDSVLVRIHVIVHRPAGVPDVDIPALEERLADAVREWPDRLAQALSERWPEPRPRRWRTVSPTRSRRPTATSTRPSSPLTTSP